jgi:stage V sporulation protein K
MENDLIKNLTDALVNSLNKKSIRLEKAYNCSFISSSISKELRKEIESKIEFYNEVKPKLIALNDSVEILNSELLKLNSGTFSKLLQGSKIKELEQKISSSNTMLNKLKKNLIENQINLPIGSLDNKSMLSVACQNLIKEKYNWSFTENSRYPIVEIIDKVDFLSNEFRVSIRFNTGILDCKEIYFFNDYSVVKHNESLSFYHNSDILVKYSESNYVEQEYNEDNNSKIVDETWHHTNNDGSRNQRIKENPSIPIRLYSNILIQLPQDSLHLVSTNTKLAFEFSSALNDFVSKSKEIKTSFFSYHSISEKEYAQYAEVIIKLINLSNQLKIDKDFYLYLSNNHNTSDPKEAIFGNVLFDLVDSAKQVSNIFDTESKEYFILCIFILSFVREEVYDYKLLYLINSPKVQKYINNVLKDIHVVKKTTNGLRFINFLNSFKQDVSIHYSKIFYDYLRLVCLSDGEISSFEQNFLSNLTSQDITTRKSKGNDESNEDIASVVNEINDLVGLQTVKNEIQSLTNLIKIQNARKKEGLITNSLNYHLVFTGNPGTGKTTVARIVSKVFKELGILKQGHLVETDRAGLIAEYVGQTAVKVNKLVDSALDGVLFIDEAYSITDSGGNDYGKEAISTLLKRMEDERDRLVVIVAGYSDKMNAFLESNPGLSSRFNRYIDFEDYNSEDLIRIFFKFVESNQYLLTEEAKDNLNELIKKDIQNKDENFGNGRYVRNIFEKTIEKQSNRIAKLKELNKDILKSIEGEDIPL